MEIIMGEIKEIDRGTIKVSFLDPETKEEKEGTLQLKLFPNGKVGDTFKVGVNKGKLVRDDKFVLQVFENNVIEIQQGKVEVVTIAWEVGKRLKVAVRALAQKTNPIASCIGEKGSVISKITKDLGNYEKIDIMLYSDDPLEFIQSAITPAKNAEIKVDEEAKTAEILVDEENLGLAIGKSGVNIKLASKITGYKLYVKVVGIEIYDLDLPKNVVTDLVKNRITTIDAMHNALKDKEKMSKLDIDTVFILMDMCKNDPRDGIICPCCGTRINEEPEHGKIICPQCGEDILVNKPKKKAKK